MEVAPRIFRIDSSCCDSLSDSISVCYLLREDKTYSAISAGVGDAILGGLIFCVVEEEDALGGRNMSIDRGYTRWEMNNFGMKDRVFE